MTRFGKEDCLADLKLRILTCDLEPGAPLDETALAARYGLSRTPLREVIQRLAGAGFVTSEENRGARVGSMDVATLRTFFRTAPLIYGNVARLAAENRTPAQLDSLEAAQTAFTRAIAAEDTAGAALNNHRFHALIGDMAANPYLRAALNRLLIDHTRLSQTFYRPESPAERTLIATARDQHDAMIAAIEARDSDAAYELTLQHWTLSRDRLDRFVRPDPLPLDTIAAKDRENAV